MWEPFSEPARRTIVRAQEVAQMFGSAFIGTEHLAFALAEGDDGVGHALAGAVDRDAIRERLGGVSSAPVEEMVFNVAAKRSIESAFENARKLSHNYIGLAHLALGVLDSGDPPPLASGADPMKLRVELIAAALGDDPARNGWHYEGSDEPAPAARAMIGMAQLTRDFAQSGARVTIEFAPPNGEARTWTWTYVEDKP